MLKRSYKNTRAFLAGDKTLIQEVLHPKNEDVELPYSLAYATLEPGHSSMPHIMQASSEVYVIVKGRGEVFIDEESTWVESGDVIHIPASAQQYVKNSGQESLEFWCIVSPPWSAADELVM